MGLQSETPVSLSPQKREGLAPVHNVFPTCWPVADGDAKINCYELYLKSTVLNMTYRPIRFGQNHFANVIRRQKMLCCIFTL